MNKMRFYVIIGILLLVLNTSAIASTDWAPPESLYLENIQIADLIVVGNISHVISKYSGGGENGNIITTADLEVHEILKQGNQSSF